MQCPNCGAQLEGTPKFCYNCGKPTEQAARAAPPPAQAAPAAPPPAKPKKKFPRWIIGVVAGLVVLLLACVVIAGGITWALGLHRTNQAAKMVPDDATVFITVSPTLRQLPGLRHWRNLTEGGAILGGIPQLLGLGGGLASGDLGDVGGLGSELDFQEDVLPWIGREVSAAMVQDPQSGDIQWMVFAATRNQRKSDEFVQKIQDQMRGEGFEFRQTIYRRTEVVEATDGYSTMAFATVNHMVVVASDAETIRSIISAAGDRDTPTLAQDPAFKQAERDLPRSRLGYVYMSFGPLMEELGYELEDTPLEMTLGGLRALESFVLAPQLHKDGLILNYATHYDTRALPPAQRARLRADASSHRLTRVVPEESLIYLSGQNPAAAVEWMQNTEWGYEILDELEYDLGFNLGDDLVSDMRGEYALVITRDPDGLFGEGDVPIGGLLYVETDDTRRAEETLEDLASEMADELEFDFYPDEINRVQVWLLEDPYYDTALGYGFVKTNLFIATSRYMLELAVEGTRLSDNRLFQTTIRQLPRQSTGYIYIDVQGAIAALYREMDDWEQDEFDESIRPYVESVLSIGIASKPMTSDGLREGVLFVHTDAQ